MAFENIDCIKPTVASNPVPDDGIAVSARKLAIKKTGRTSRFIKMVIGAGLARKISLTQDKHNLRLLFGTGEDSGKIQISADDAPGGFSTNRDKQGRYSLTINQASADGLFALEFPAFARSGLEALRPENGKRPYFVFRASDEMLNIED